MFNARTLLGSLLRFLLGFTLLLVVALGLAAITSSDAQEAAIRKTGATTAASPVVSTR